MDKPSATPEWPFRSLLFIPANKSDWIRKSPRFAADAIIMDLEDAVPPEQKKSARDSAREGAQFLRTQNFCRKLKELDLLEPMQAQGSGLTVVRDDKVNTPYILKKMSRKTGDFSFSIERLPAGQEAPLSLMAFGENGAVMMRWLTPLLAMLAAS